MKVIRFISISLFTNAAKSNPDDPSVLYFGSLTLLSILVIDSKIFLNTEKKISKKR